MSSIYGIMFGLALLALASLSFLLLLTIFSRGFKLWPTPSATSWQHYTFWPLFRGGLGLTILFSLLTLTLPEAEGVIRFSLGTVLAGIGLAITIYGYFDLGLGNTYGSDEGLVTGGLYRYSRNPQYVASILGFSGLALANGGLQAIVLCGFAILVYVLLPYAEEPWLTNVYGNQYIVYRKKTPRFLGIKD